MTSAGWYPDPAGTPNTYRYWDGQSWSQQTSTDPYGAGRPEQQVQPVQPVQPPEPPQPVQPVQPVQPTPPMPTYAPVPPPPQQPPAAYGAMPQHQPQQWSPMPGAPTPGQGGSGAGRTIAIVTGAVAFLVLLAILAFVGVKVLGGGDDTSARPSGQPTPSTGQVPGTTPPGAVPPALGTITPSTQQCAGGVPSASFVRVGDRISAGGLSAPSLKDHGYVAYPNIASALTFVNDLMATSKVVTTNWISTLVVAGVSREGFSSPENAARTLMVCTAEAPQMYQNPTALDELSATPVTVDGHRGFSITENIKVDEPGLKYAGDTVQIVVVDTGDAHHYGLFLMAVPIDDKPLLALQKSAAEQLHVK